MLEEAERTLAKLHVPTVNVSLYTVTKHMRLTVVATLHLPSCQLICSSRINSTFAVVPDVGRFRRGHRDLIAPRFTRCELRLLAFCHLPPKFLTLRNRENAALPSPIAPASITPIKALAVFLQVNV